jgi:putative ABC transport system ATP-binding protein
VFLTIMARLPKNMPAIVLDQGVSPLTDATVFGPYRQLLLLAAAAMSIVSILGTQPEERRSASEARSAPAPDHVVFRARSLTKIYGTGSAQVRALDGVDLDLHEGELVVLLGPSGSGKTTLLNNLGGLDVPTSGELKYRDLDLAHAGEDRLTRYRRISVGFVFQFYNLIPSLTARENVAIISEIARNAMSAEEALGMVNLGARLDHFPAQLSGGEQQRVAIARAIAKRPEVLLCDEPTGALDVQTGILVLEAIERVNRELGTLTAIITHNAAMAGMADRVIRFSDGKVQGVHRNAARAAPATLVW